MNHLFTAKTTKNAERWLPGGQNRVDHFAVLAVFAVRSSLLSPYSWRAVLPLVLAGFLAAGLDSTPKARGFLSLVIGGAWLLGIGTWTLVRYLRAHPKPDVGREGRP